jgi:hypothetical protein
MRAMLTAFLAALFILSSVVSGQATGRGGPPHSGHVGFPVSHYPFYPGAPGHHHHDHDRICKVYVIKRPEIKKVGYGRHHYVIVYTIIKKVVCFKPISHDW